MKLDVTHPEYVEAFPLWEKMKDCYEGEDKIKKKGVKYLPMTQSMKTEYPSGFVNTVNYMGLWNTDSHYYAYTQRAIFYDYVHDAVKAMMGLLHRESPIIELPDELEYMRKTASIFREGLFEVLRRINEQQLIYGRVGILLDLSKDELGKAVPYLALYGSERIKNWCYTNITDQKIPYLNYVCLDESGSEFEEGKWEFKKKSRVLLLNEETYQTALCHNDQFIDTDLITPSSQVGSLNQIPFVFIGSQNILPDIAPPPLLGLANLCLAIYRNEADYEQNLFMQAQDTLVIKDAVLGQEKKDIAIGAGNRIDLSYNGDAYYIGVTGNGLTEQRIALENLKSQALQKAGQFVTSAQKESGDAMAIRLGSQTAMLTQIALTGAKGLETILKTAASWIGANPDEVSVKPNLDFTNDTLSGGDLKELMAFTMAGGLSKQSLHEYVKSKGFTDLTYEEEQEQIQAEQEAGHFLNTQVTTANDAQPSDIAAQDQEAMDENPVP